jgi:hypothetical protein
LNNQGFDDKCFREKNWALNIVKAFENRESSDRYSFTMRLIALSSESELIDVTGAFSYEKFV